mgnify:CR=1 FL=1
MKTIDTSRLLITGQAIAMRITYYTVLIAIVGLAACSKPAPPETQAATPDKEAAKGPDVNDFKATGPADAGKPPMADAADEPVTGDVSLDIAAADTPEAQDVPEPSADVLIDIKKKKRPRKVRKRRKPKAKSAGGTKRPRPGNPKKGKTKYNEDFGVE